MRRKISKKTASDSSRITYEHFAKTYLLSAKLLLEAETPARKRNTGDQWRLEQGLIYIPVIYSIRHSIELFLKSIDVGNNSSYLRTHNLEELQEELDELDLNLKSAHLKLIDKYVTYDFGIDLLDTEVVDTENDVFRFPENKAGVRIKGENLSKLQTNEMLQDIDSLKKLYIQLSIESQIKKQLKAHGVR